MEKQRKLRSNAITTHEFLHNGDIRFGVPGVGSAVLRFADVSLENRFKCQQEGAVKTVINRAALERDPETGASATPETKWRRMLDRIEHLNSGATSWSQAREAAGGGDDAGLIVQATMRVKGWTVEQVEAWIAKVCVAKSLERKAVIGNLRKNPDVIRAVAEIKAERAAANKAADAVDFLKEMEETDFLDDDSTQVSDEEPEEVAPEDKPTFTGLPINTREEAPF